MLRVPVNGPRSEPRSLEQAKAAGADVRPIASPLDAVRIAQENPNRPVVFLAAGFETTTAPCAAMLAQGAPDNLSVLLAGRRTWPIVAQLLESGTAAFDALVAPGHVATVMGPEEWEFVVTRHGMPAAIAGFMPGHAARGDLFRAAAGSRARARSSTTAIRPPCGRAEIPRRRRFLERVMDVVDANWRGIGVVPQSGLRAAARIRRARFTRAQFPGYRDLARKRAGEMPPGCDCAQVVLGRIRPNECRLYGVACTPHHPIGPCMVSDEGACRIWWASGVREPARPSRRVAAAG